MGDHIDCLFCKIAKGEIPSESVYSDDRVYAFRDVDPKAPVHVLVIPREHIASLAQVSKGFEALEAHMLYCVRKIAAAEGLDDEGYRVVTNVGKNGGQSVEHLHFHILGGRVLTWPPG
jgi:histidine triad (HIT) family protein